MMLTCQRSIICAALAGILLAVSWSALAAWTLSNPQPPPAVTLYRGPLVANPLGSTYHLPTCRYIDITKPLLRFNGEEAAIRSGRHPCDHCLSEIEKLRQLASRSLPPAARAGTQ